MKRCYVSAVIVTEAVRLLGNRGSILDGHVSVQLVPRKSTRDRSSVRGIPLPTWKGYTAIYTTSRKRRLAPSSTDKIISLALRDEKR